MQVFQIWKTSGLEDFQTTSRKYSRRLPGSLLVESSLMSHFHNRSEHFLFLIRWFSSSTCICFLEMGLIYMFFRSGLDFGRPMGSLLRSLLKYSALGDFQKVFQTTSIKSSDEAFFHIKWSLSLSL
ncbi:hypothetical protein F2Q69_00005414 [Brassica cretica]|uniref:Uncharacterized protein n=1 Tax=Brassica cretica TaxID=69181 RepID=A0A8S9PFP8_BRACR|nr:hypothetical protein F2Q69_00005414 [Brassica cretica]